MLRCSTVLAVWILSGVQTLLAGPYLPPVEPVETPSPGKPLAEPEYADTQSPKLGFTKHREAEGLQIRSYEPSRIGLTFDEGDGGFLDLVFSMQFPFLHDYYPDVAGDGKGEAGIGTKGKVNGEDWWIHPYLGATVRAGQYIESRKSNPVAGKRFNPLISFRRWLDRESEVTDLALNRFVEFVYAHESNGQWIGDKDVYDAAWATHYLDAAGLDDEARMRQATLVTRDEISRGWDYVGLNGKWAFAVPKAGGLGTVWVKASHYLDWGLAQKDAEEFNVDFETDPEGKPRNAVDGFTLRLDYQWDWLKQKNLLTGEFMFEWTTGIGRPFEFNTYRTELGLNWERWSIPPLSVWYRYGYNSDFIDYYRQDESWGIQLYFDKF